MPGDEVSVRDRLLYDVELAIGRSNGSDADPSFSADILAERGEVAVNSIFAETMLAIDKLPKAFELARFGKVALSGQGADLLHTVDQSIQFNKRYSQRDYLWARDHFSYADYETPPQASLVVRSGSRVPPENALAALHNSVRDGCSKRRPYQQAWEAYTPSRIIETMRIAQVIDLDLMKTLADTKREGHYSTPDYVNGLVHLADKTTEAIALRSQNKPTKKPKAVQTSTNKSLFFNRPVGLSMIAFGAITEVMHIASVAMGDENIPDAALRSPAALFVAGMGGLVLRQANFRKQGSPSS